MLFAHSRRLDKLIGDASKQALEHFDLYNLVLGNTAIRLYISHKKANKASHIHCAESGDIIWEQLYPFGGMSRPAREREYVLKPECDKSVITVIAIRGTPGSIIGLDNGIFKSHMSAPQTGGIYLMKEALASEFLELV